MQSIDNKGLEKLIVNAFERKQPFFLENREVSEEISLLSFATTREIRESDEGQSTQWVVSSEIVFKNCVFSGVVDISNIRFEKPVRFLNCVFKEEFKAGQDISFCDFREEVDCSKSIFHFEANFGKAVFSDRVDFSEVSFLGYASFDSCEFLKSADFEMTKFQNVSFWSSRFLDSVSFHSSEFLGQSFFLFCRFQSAFFSEVNFLNALTFENSEFLGEAIFSDVKFFYPANFSSSKFQKECTFSGSEFLQGGYFEHALFESNLMLTHVEMLGELKCRSLIVKGDANFQKSNYKKNIEITHNAEFHRLISFHESSLLDGAKLDFQDARFYERVIFDDIKLKDNSEVWLKSCAFFDNAEVFFNFSEMESQEALSGRIVFSKIRNLTTEIIISLTNLSNRPYRVYFEGCKFPYKSVYFLNAKLENIAVARGGEWQGFIFNDCQWEKIELPMGRWENWPGIKPLEFYALPDEGSVICSCCSGETNHAKQREGIYNSLKKDFADKGDSWMASNFYAMQMYWNRMASINKGWNTFYLVTSGYGLSVVRPLLFLGYSSFAIAFIYFICSELKLDFFNDENLNIINLTLDGLNPFRWLTVEGAGLKKYNDYWVLWLLSLIHHLFILYCIFEIGAAIRNKVRR